MAQNTLISSSLEQLALNGLNADLYYMVYNAIVHPRLMAYSHCARNHRATPQLYAAVNTLYPRTIGAIEMLYY